MEEALRESKADIVFHIASYGMSGREMVSCAVVSSMSGREMVSCAVVYILIPRLLSPPFQPRYEGRFL